MAAPTPKPPVAYVEEPGVIEFSGQIIVKPITKAEADAQGLTEEEYQLARANAISAIYAEATTDNDIHYIEALDHYVITVPSGKTETSLSNEFLGSGNFSFSEPNWICNIICTNDPSVADNTQWHHTRIDSCDAWTIETGSPSVVVAIVDTGIDTAHPDLQLHRQEAWDMRYPFASPPPIRRESLGAVVTDNNSHGTHCLGIAAANGNNGIGISGVGQSLGHRSLKVNDGNSSGSASYVTINEAIKKAADLGDKVISVSWSFGTNSYSSRVDAATYAKERGSLVFNAAGNSSTYLSFANYGNKDLLLVGSIENTGDQRSGFSSYGEGVFIWAPGSAIYSTIPSSTYGYKSGTSMACPMVAGLAALIWSRNPNLSTTQVKEILLNSADSITITGADSNSYNVKRINSYSAMLATPLPDSTDSTDSTDIPDYTDNTDIPDYTDSTNIPDNTDVVDPDITDSTDGEQRNPVILVMGPLSKINVYPVVYAKDTNGNILKDTNGNKIILKNYQDVLLTDEYTIVTEITSG